MTDRLRSQQVSFGDLDGQERARRFTISAQPSAINLASNNPNAVTNSSSSSSSQVPGSQPSSNVPSRSQSIIYSPQTSRKPSQLNTQFQPQQQQQQQQLQQLNPPAPSNQSSRNNSTISAENILLFFASSAHKPNHIPLTSINTTAEYISSGSSSRVASPKLESPNPTFLKNAYLMDSENGSSSNRLNTKSPPPPPFGKENGGNFANTSPPKPINILKNKNKIDDYLDVGVGRRSSKKQIVASPVGPPVPFQQYLTKEDDGKFHILIGCTGSVATIKVPLIIDKLFQTYGTSTVSIQLVVTKAAGHFLKGLKLHKDVKIWRDDDEWVNYNDQFNNILSTTTASSSNTQVKKPKNPFDKLILHNELRKWADIMVIAPLSANTLAKIANGIADNLLLSIIRSWGPASGSNIKKPILVAPAMNTFMYTHPITAKQLKLISSPENSFGIEVLKPVEKVLVCGDIGMGGMREWLDIVNILRSRISALKELSGHKDSALSNLGTSVDDEDGDDDDEDEDDDDEDDDDEDEDEDEDEDDEEGGDNGSNDDNESNDKAHKGKKHNVEDDGMIFDITDDQNDDESNLKFSNPPETQNII